MLEISDFFYYRNLSTALLVVLTTNHSDNQLLVWNGISSDTMLSFLKMQEPNILAVLFNIAKHPQCLLDSVKSSFLAELVTAFKTSINEDSKNYAAMTVALMGGGVENSVLVEMVAVMTSLMTKQSQNAGTEVQSPVLQPHSLDVPQGEFFEFTVTL